MIPEESWPIICFGGTLHLDIVIQMSASPSLSAPAPFLGDLVKPSPNPKLMSLDLQKPFSGFLGARAPCFPLCLPALRFTWNDSGSSPSIASIKKKKISSVQALQDLGNFHWDLLGLWSSGIFLNPPPFSPYSSFIALGLQINPLPLGEQFCPQAEILTT